MTRLKDATFTTGTTTGTDAFGSVSGATVDTTSKIKGANSARTNWSASANVTGSFTSLGASELFVSLYIQVAARPPSGSPRVITFSNGSTQCNIVLTSTGTLQFKNNGTTLFTTSALTNGTTYRLGIHLKVSSAAPTADAVFELFFATGDADFGAAVYSNSAQTMNTTNANFTSMVLGQNNGSSASGNVYWDSIRIDTTAMPAQDTRDVTFTAAASFATLVDKTFTAAASFVAASGTIDKTFTASSSFYAQVDKTFTAASSFAIQGGSNFTAAASFVKLDINTTFTASSSFAVPVDKTWTAASSFANAIDKTFTAAASFSFSYVPTPAHTKFATFESGTTTGTNGVDAVTGTVTVDTTSKIKGANSATSSTATSYLQLQPSNTDELWVSFYYRMSALPASSLRLVQVRQSLIGGLDAYRIHITTAGKLEIRDDNGSSLIVGASTLSINTNYRIGFHYKRATDTAPAVFQVYLATADNDFGSAEIAITGSSNGYANIPINRVFIGNTSGSTTWFIDDVALSTTAMPGPSATVARWDNQFTAAASFAAIGRKQGKWRFYTDAATDASMTAIAAENTTPTLSTAQSETSIIRLRVTIKNSSGGSLTENLKLQYSQDGTNWQDVGDSSNADHLWVYAAGAATAGGALGSALLSDSTTLGVYHEDGATSETVANSGAQEIDFAIRAQGAVMGTTYKFRVVQSAYDLPLDTGAVQIQATTSSSPTQGIAAFTAESGVSNTDHLAGFGKVIYDGARYWLFYAKPATTATIFYRSWTGSGSWSSEGSVAFGSAGADYSDGFFSVDYKLIGTTKTVVISGTAQNYGLVSGAEAPNFVRGVISTSTITWDSYYPVHNTLTSTEIAGQSATVITDANMAVTVFTNASGNERYMQTRGQQPDTGTGFGSFTAQFDNTTSSFWSGRGLMRIVATGNDGSTDDTVLAMGVNVNGALIGAETYHDTAGVNAPGTWGGNYTFGATANPVDWNALRVGDYTYIVYRDAATGGNWKLGVFRHSTGAYALATNQPGINNSLDNTGLAMVADTTNNWLYVFGIFAGANGTGSRVVKYARYAYGSGGTGGTWANVGAAVSADRGKISHVQVAPLLVSGKILIITEEGDDGLVGTDSAGRYFLLNQGSPTSTTFTAAASFIGAAVIDKTFTASASFQKQIDKTFTASSSFVATLVAATFTASSSFYAQVDKTFTAAAGFATQSSATFTASASFQVLHDTQFSASASFVKQDIDTTFTATSSFYKQRDISIQLSASFIQQTDSFFQASASFIAQVDKTFTATSSFSGQVDKTFTAAASFKKTNIDTQFTASAMFSDGFSFTFTASASFARQVTAATWTAVSAWRGTYDKEFQIYASFAPEQEIQFSAAASFVAGTDISVDMVAAFVLQDKDTTFTSAASFAPAVDINFTATASFISQNEDTPFQASVSFARNGDITFSARASFQRQNITAATFTAAASFVIDPPGGPVITFQPIVNNIVTYQVVIANRSGVIRDTLTKRQFISLDYTRAANTVTELKIVLPGSYDRHKLEGDGIIAVYRKVGTNPMYLDTDTVWFIRTIERTVDDNGQKLYTVTAESANSLANQYLVGYQNKKTLGYTTKQDEAGDMILAIAAENFGTSATNTLRQISITLEGASGKGVLIYKQFGWRYLSEVFKEICDTSFVSGVPLYWDIISVNAPLGLEFRVYTNQRGRDRRSSTNSPLIVGPRQKSITGFSVVEDYKGEMNYVYVAGPGEEDDRPVIEYEDSARSRRGPYSHKEGFVDLRDAASLQTFAYEGQGALRAGQPKITYQGKLASVPGAIYGLDWFFGDRLTAQDDEAIGYDCRVNAVHVTVSNNGEEVIDAALRNDE